MLGRPGAKSFPRLGIGAVKSSKEAEESIRFTGKRHLEGSHAEWIATQGVQRMQPMNMIIGELKECAFAFEDSGRATTHGSLSVHE